MNFLSSWRRRSKALSAPTAEAARRLAGEGRRLEALAVAETVFADLADADLARETVAWRHAAFADLPKQGRSDWPADYADPAPTLVDAIPEVSPAALTAGVLGGALHHHGSLIVRGLLGPEQIAQLKGLLFEAFESRAAGRTDGAYAVAPIDTPDLAMSRGLAQPGAQLMLDAPAFLARWMAMLKTLSAFSAVKDYLGETPVISANKTTLYKIGPDIEGQWHQDGAFLGELTRTVNLWVALTDCGVDAPGLKIVPWRLDHIVETGAYDAPHSWTVANRTVDELANGRPMAFPVFKAGDAMLFDHLCLHSTGRRPEMTRERLAIETWLFAPSHYPDAAPLVI